jgi:hypothetical protein
MARLEEQFNVSGIRRSVEAVIIVTVSLLMFSCSARNEVRQLTVKEHGFPHVLTLQVANSYYKLYVDPDASYYPHRCIRGRTPNS